MEASPMALWVKKSICNAGARGDTGLIPASGRSPGGGNGNPLQYSCLENSMERRAWQAIVHMVEESWTQLSMSTTTMWLCARKKKNIRNSIYFCTTSVMAWRVVTTLWQIFFKSYISWKQNSPNEQSHLGTEVSCRVINGGGLMKHLLKLSGLNIGRKAWN